MRIVVADDRADVRAIHCGWIAARFPGTRIIAVTSLTEGLRALVEHHPVGLALLDLRTAGMSGFQGLSAVRRYFPEVRCIAVGTPEPATVEETLRLGVRGFLPDGATEGEFTSALAAVLAGSRHIPVPTGLAPTPAGLSAVARLTPREKDILLLLRDGLPNKVIANRLAVSEVTVKSHLGKAFRKLGVQNRLQALRFVVEVEGP